MEVEYGYLGQKPASEGGMEVSMQICLGKLKLPRMASSILREVLKPPLTGI